MNHINLANHLQNLIYYKDEYLLFYPRTPADSRHNITELKFRKFCPTRPETTVTGA